MSATKSTNSIIWLKYIFFSLGQCLRIAVMRPNRVGTSCPFTDFFFFFFLRHYNFREVLAFTTNSFHLGRFLMQSLQFIFIFAVSLFTSSSHRFLGLPSDLVRAGDHSYTFLPRYCLAYGVRVQTRLVFML